MSILAHYTWNENDTVNTRDYTTLGNHSSAMFVTSIIDDVANKAIGKVVNMNGVSNVITFGNIMDFGGTDSMSIVAKTRTSGTADNVIAFKEDQWEVGIDASNKAYIKLFVGASENTLTSSATIGVGGDYKTIIWTYDGSTGLSIYIDGTQDANTLMLSGNIDASSNNVLIGSDTVEFYNGRIEMFSAYEQTLTQENVSAIVAQPGGVNLSVSDATQFSVGDLVALTDKPKAAGDKLDTAGSRGTITGILSDTKLLFLPLFSNIPHDLDIMKHRGNVFDTSRQCIYDSINNNGAPFLIMRDGVSTFTPPDSTIKVQLSCESTLMSSIEASGPIFFNNPISPPAFTVGAQDDWNPTDLDVTNMIRATSTNPTGTDITGMVAPAPAKNQVIFFTNIGSKTIVLKNNDSGSALANRFQFRANISVQTNEGALLVYDRDSLRWKAIAINT